MKKRWLWALVGSLAIIFSELKNIWDAYDESDSHNVDVDVDVTDAEPSADDVVEEE